MIQQLSRPACSATEEEGMRLAMLNLARGQGKVTEDKDLERQSTYTNAEFREGRSHVEKPSESGGGPCQSALPCSSET